MDKAAIGLAKSLSIKRIAGYAFKVDSPSGKVLERLGFRFAQIVKNRHDKPTIPDKTGVLYELKLD